jgi:hypothetical protein
MTIAELKEENVTELSRIARTLEIPGTYFNKFLDEFLVRI